MEKTFPDYAVSCPNWCREANAMAQYAIWTGLSALGYGANIQHYAMSPGDLNWEYKLPKEWTFISAMAFGVPSDKLKEHTHLPTEEVLLIKE
jgi:predicted oxidoreductase (fatty acid repression mutant protein)